MKKIALLCLLLIAVLVSCTQQTEIGDTILRETVELFKKKTNITVDQSIELKTEKEFNMRYTVTNFMVSEKGNYEMYELKTGKNNGVLQESLKQEVYMYLSNNQYCLYNQNISKHPINYTNWYEYVQMQYLFEAVTYGFDSEDSLYTINALNIADYLYGTFYGELGTNYSRSVLENKSIIISATMNEAQNELKMTINVTNLLGDYMIKDYTNIEINIKITYNQAAFLVPSWITDADEYKIEVKERGYPHMVGNPDNVIVKHIDIGKYDQRGISSYAAPAEQDKGESSYIKVGDIDILIDAGQNNNNGATVKAIKEVIDETSNDGILDYVIVTHPHADHYGGMAEIISTYQVKTFIETSGQYQTTGWNNYRQTRAAKASEYGSTVCYYTDLLATASEQCQKTMYIADSVSLNFLNTGYETSDSANPSSVVFVLNAFGTKYLFQGDAEANQEANYAPLAGKIDLMKMPHHGTAYATYDYFLNTCDPDNIIVQNGNNLGNQYGHPTQRTINRIYSYDDSINIYAVTGGGYGETCTYISSGEKSCSPSNPSNDFEAYFDPRRFTDRNGTITTTITPSGYMITSELPEILEMSKTRYWLEHDNATYFHR